ncbi:MAG: hypothetical protein IPG45_15660 [Deltaproteobacteria bacterium]|nr:hypothetical protein [Deltaproteobacteria bacterium]
MDPPIARRIVEEVDAYALTGRGDVTKLQGSDQFRLRVGDWRVIFALLTDSNNPASRRRRPPPGSLPLTHCLFSDGNGNWSGGCRDPIP